MKLHARKRLPVRCAGLSFAWAVWAVHGAGVRRTGQEKAGGPELPKMLKSDILRPEGGLKLPKKRQSKQKRRFKYLFFSVLS